MSEPKWTAGNYSSDPDLYCIRDGGKGWIASDIVGAERANLIAAAPELYEALDKDASRFNRAADWLAGLVCTNGTAKAELVMYLKQCAVEANEAIAKVNPSTPQEGGKRS